MVVCGTVYNLDDYRKKHTMKYFEGLENKDSGQMIYVDTRYVCLYRNEEEKISLARIRDNHKMNNMFFAAQNPDLHKVPNTTRNPWATLVGNAKIQFLPIDSDTLTVEYLKIDTGLNSTSPVEDASKRAGITPEVLNIYIGSSDGGLILGQAELNSNIAYCLFSTVGGFEHKGTLASYDIGKTLCHEIGHNFSLAHTFSDQVCDNQKIYSDVPESTQPSFETEVYQLADGSWEQKNCLRDLDRQNGTDKSCLYLFDEPSSETDEMGVCVMNYGSDQASLMFSKSQALSMREFLQGPTNTTMTLRSADHISISGGGYVDDTFGVETVPLSDGISNHNNDDSSTSLSEVWIVLIFIVVVSFIIVLFYTGHKYVHSEIKPYVLKQSTTKT
jgi:hypothetical protein